MANFTDVWNNSYVVLQAAKGMFRGAYHPGAPNEYVQISGPGDESVKVPTPACVGFALAVENGKIVVWYLRKPEGSHAAAEVPVRTDIACGAPLWATLTGGVGPIGATGAQGMKGDKGDRGPAGKDATVTEEQIQRIANVTAERVFTLPPADWAASIQPPEARSGSRFQDMTTIQMLNPAFWVGVLQAMGRAARDLIKAGVKF